MGEVRRSGSPDEERVRALIREILEQEMVEWRVAFKQLVRSQEEISSLLGRLQRQLPDAATLFHTGAPGALPNGIHAERRRLARFQQSMERSYAEGRITEIDLARGRRRIAERLELLGRVESESAET